MDNLNKWITLCANIGVLIGIIVVAIELRQTQIEMRAESSTTRAQMSREIQLDVFEYGTQELGNKIADGEELSEAERARAGVFFARLLRFYENMHYQNQIGVLDEEIWQSNLNVILQLCRGENQLFNYVNSNGLRQRNSFRESFVRLIEPPCSD